MLLGALVIICALFSGLPTVWNTIAYIVIGILIISVAYTIRPMTLSEPKKETSAPFVDVHSETPQPNEGHIV